MLTQEFIRIKRDKGVLAPEDIQAFCRGIVTGEVGEGQIASFCMAVLLNGLNNEERVGLTMAMANSGIRLNWAPDNLNGPVLDKHSTGGVGDKVSLMLAPIIAACGGYVPMISGRGLGHTGGTLDKMDSIKGYISQPDLPRLRRVVKEVGCAVVGATSDIAPADRSMYAVRDVTGTVESLDLITASILSKKLAAGLNGLIMDVKFGNGAFMQDYRAARALAQSIVRVANGAGLPCTALLTDMNQVLGRTAGNAVEVREAIQFLRNESVDTRLFDVTMALIAELLVLGGLAATPQEGFDRALEQLHNGRAAEIFEKMVKALGGPATIVSHYDKHLKLAPIALEVYPEQPGIVAGVDSRAIGLAVIELGGGRRLVTDKIDHAVGISNIAAIGEDVGPGIRPLAIVHARRDNSAQKAAQVIRAAYAVAAPGAKVTPGPVISEKIVG